MKNFSTGKYVLISTALVVGLTFITLLLFGNWIDVFTTKQPAIFNVYNFGGITITYLTGLLVVVGFVSSEFLVKIYVLLSYYTISFDRFAKLEIPILNKTKSIRIKKLVFNLHKEFGKAGITNKSYFFVLQPSQFQKGDVYNLDVVRQCFQQAIEKSFESDTNIKENFQSLIEFVLLEPLVLTLEQTDSYLIDSDSVMGIELLFLSRLGFPLDEEMHKVVFATLVKLIDLDKYLCHSSFGLDDLGSFERLVKRFSKPSKHLKLKEIVDTLYFAIQSNQSKAQVNFYYSLKSYFGGN